MQKWEYHSIVARPDPSDSYEGQQIGRLVEELGEQGWELFEIVPKKGSLIFAIVLNMESFVYWFKRPRL